MVLLTGEPVDAATDNGRAGHHRGVSVRQEIYLPEHVSAGSNIAASDGAVYRRVVSHRTFAKVCIYETA